MTPKVTVLMPVYNAASFLKEAVESILNQTFRDFEFIIINDGSTDLSQKILECFTDPRISIVKNEHNIGIIKSRNKGILLARGVYIANMDADDISLPTRLEKQVKFLDQHPQIAALATKLVLINERDEEYGVWPEDYNCTTQKQIAQILPRINCIGQPTVMMRSSTVRKIGYNNKYLHNEDWGLWLNILSKGESIAKLDELLLKYRIHPNSTTVKANMRGVRKKIIRFKYTYLCDHFLKGGFNKTENEVLRSLPFDIVKLLPFYGLLVRLHTIKPLRLLIQFLKTGKQLSQIKKTVGPIFFFPFYHTGGAEKVHASILESISDKNSLVFATMISGNNALLNDFKKYATVIDVGYLVNFRPTKEWLIKKIKSICRKSEKTVLFGSNSKFFYDLLSVLKSEVKAIDLIHAFMHKYENGAEKWSLPTVQFLSNRVVINQKTKSDLKELYNQNHIPEEFLNRIVCIPNFANPKKYNEKTINNEIVVLFVGRGSLEKRITLIADAARIAFQKGLNAKFHFVGKIIDEIPPDDAAYCTLHGEITDPATLDSMYNKAHILVIASSREGFPMVMMEAMMHGVVPVSTNVGGIPEHITNNNNGILIETQDETEIVNKIVSAIEYFSIHKNEYKDMSLRAHQYATVHFNKGAFFQSYQKLLK